MSLVNPSFSNGFSSPWYGGRMKYADLWRGCVGSWAPILGPTGATLFDFSGYSKHGTLTNMDLATVWKIGQRGYEIDLDGADDWANLGTATSLNWSVVRSMMFTVQFDAFSSHVFSLWDVVGGVNQRSVIHSTDGSGTLYQLWSPDGSADGTAITAPATLGVSHTVCSVYRSGTRELWLDGSLRSSLSASIYTGATTSRLGYGCVAGRSGDSPVAFADGKIGPAAIWDRALTPSEISLLAQRPGIMYELDDSDVWGAVEAGGSVPWWAFANRQSRIIGGGVT